MTNLGFILHANLDLLEGRGKCRAGSRIGCAFASAWPFSMFSGGPSDHAVFDLTGWAGQLANGFEARGIPRDVIGPMIEPSLPIVPFEEVRPDMHFRLRVFDSESQRFVKRTCAVESYRRVKKTYFSRLISDHDNDENSGSSVSATTATAPRKQLNVVCNGHLGLRRTYGEQTWNKHFIARGVMVRGQVLDMNFSFAQTNLFVAIRHGLLRVIRMILDFAPADLMFKEIHRFYRSDEQAGFLLGVSRWRTRNGKKSQRATPYQWARIFGKPYVILLFDDHLGKLEVAKRKRENVERFRLQQRSFDIAGWAETNGVKNLHDAAWWGYEGLVRRQIPQTIHYRGSVDAQNSHHATAMMLAIHRGHLEV